MSNMIETEIKLYVPDLDAIAARITAGGGKLIAPRVFERNVRYDRPDLTMTETGIVLRLREDSRVRLTYKGPGMIDDGALTRTEIEVTVDSFERMDIILQQLGYIPYVTYEKYRTTYRLGEAEIVLDEMPYGNFVEIEAPTNVIHELIGQLHLVAAPRLITSYLRLFDHIKAALGLDMRHLTFANFEGVTVPPELFETYGG